MFENCYLYIGHLFMISASEMMNPALFLPLRFCRQHAAAVQSGGRGQRGGAVQRRTRGGAGPAHRGRKRHSPGKHRDPGDYPGLGSLARRQTGSRGPHPGGGPSTLHDVVSFYSSFRRVRLQYSGTGVLNLQMGSWSNTFSLFWMIKVSSLNIF